MGFNEKLKYIVIFVGQTGAGKDTAAKLFPSFLEQAKMVVSTTTRPKRSKEIHGIDYFFISPESFEEKKAANLFLDTVYYSPIINGVPQKQGYAISVEHIPEETEVICFSADIDRAKKIKALYPKKTIIVYIKAPHFIRRARAEKRDVSFSLQEWRRRNASERLSYANILEEADWIIDNTANLKELKYLGYAIKLLMNKV